MWNVLKYKYKSVAIYCITLLMVVGFVGSSSVFAAPNSKSDTRLAQLSINCGSLVPEFSPDIYEYEVYVTNDQQSKDCKTSVKLKNSTAKVTAEGPSEFKDSDIEKKITVTASGDQKSTYTIKVHIVRDTEILEDGKLYQNMSKVSLKDLPEGFQKTKHTIKGTSMLVAENKEADLILIPYENAMDDTDMRWYSYDQSDDELTLATIKKIGDENYIAITSGKELVYGDSNGTPGYYLYDTKTEQIQSLSNEKSSFEILILVIAISVTILICFILFFVLRIGKKRKLQRQQQKEMKYFRPYLSFEEGKRKNKGE